ncbi:MAG: divergent polysaccharide deacetylase family protein [Sulfuricurvum sp.]|nr:divergent polysaccharide deacetylase family protein [Sulfuricurvum sp.]
MDKSPFSFRIFFTLKSLIFLLSLLIIVILALIIGYFIGFNQVQEKLDQERDETQRLMARIQEISKVDSNVSERVIRFKVHDAQAEKLKKELKELLKHDEVSARHEYSPKDKKVLPPPAEPRAIVPVKSCGGKLVIIMDDVSYAHDVAAIRSTGLPLVMSFLPPSPRHPESATLAASVSGYMVHLPMEAVTFHQEEPVTLRISDSIETIEKQITLVKRLYPNVRYINNHTGSKFTSDEPAMDRLIGVMKENGLIFVDSRTIGTSKAKVVGAKYGLRYLGRDVFLDHEDGVENVKKQIRSAVAIAKRHGSAIAIGHPRPDTIRALKESKDILNQVQIVRIDQI